MARAYVGSGWSVYHLTDRTVVLRKDDHAYRRFTGRDGFVIVRSEPWMDRHQMIDKAIQMAHRNDELMAIRVAKGIAPSLQSLADFTGKQVRMTRAMETPEDVDRIGVKQNRRA